ncbi:MAG TPA: S-layer homology domain-containing protein, partial [Chloroflexia bacterium]|nr:S-layer homology domain-containing protein [Chloroflexia bacterium]
LAAGNVYTSTGATFYPALARYNPDGSPDTTFDTDGLVVTTVLTKTIIYAMSVQPDGKILLAGAGGGFLLMRYNSNGSLDTTFDGDGVVLADFPSVQGEGASDLQVLSNGQIVVNGSSSTGTNSLSQFTLARFNSDGSIDTNFGTGGLVTTAFATNAYSRASALQPDGRVVLAGGSNGDFAMARYVMTGGAAPSPTATLGTASSPSPTATTGTTPPCTIQFTDVPSTNTFHPFITCLACKGIVSGYPDGTFRYGNNVTRGQISKMVSNSAGFAESPDPQIYEDVPPGSPFYEWVNRLSRRGHMGGYTCGGVNPQTGQAEPCSGDSKPYFRPGNNASRGQVSKIVANGAGFVEAPTGQYFADVPTDNPFYEWIGRLTSRGVMSGYPCGAENPDTGEAEPCDEQERPYFRWANQITRGQTAKIVAGAFFPGCQTPARK